jgi:hypothetical protein
MASIVAAETEERRSVLLPVNIGAAAGDDGLKIASIHGVGQSPNHFDVLV